MLAREKRLAREAEMKSASSKVVPKVDELDEALKERNKKSDIFGLGDFIEEVPVSVPVQSPKRSYDPQIMVFTFARAWQQLTGKDTDFTYSDFRSAHKARDLKPYEAVRYEKYLPDGRVFRFTDSQRENFYVHFSKYGVEDGRPVFRYNTDAEVKARKEVLRGKVQRKRIAKANELKEKRRERSDAIARGRHNKSQGIFSPEVEEKYQNEVLSQVVISEKKQRRTDQLSERRARAQAEEASRVARINRRRAKRNAKNGTSLPMVTSVSEALSLGKPATFNKTKEVLNLEGEEKYSGKETVLPGRNVFKEIIQTFGWDFLSGTEFHHWMKSLADVMMIGPTAQLMDGVVHCAILINLFTTRHVWRHSNAVHRALNYVLIVRAFYVICDRSLTLAEVDIFQDLYEYSQTVGEALLPQLFALFKRGESNISSSVNLKMEGETPFFEDFIDGLENSLDQLESVHGGTLVQSLLNVLRLSAFMKFFDKDTALTLRRYIGDDSANLKGMTVPQLGIYALRQVLTVVKVSSLVTKGYSFNDVLSIGNDRNRLLAEAKYLIQNKDNVYFGRKVEGKVSVRHFVTRCRKIIEALEENLKTFSRLSAESAKNREVITALGSVISEHESVLASNNRVAPMVIAAIGPPAIGKSTLIDLYSRIPDYYDGIKYDPSHRYSKNAVSQYWEKYSPLEHSVVFLSEIGRFTQPYVNAHGDATMDEFLTMADSLPYLVNKAAIEGKGNTPFNSSLIVIDSNNPTLGLNKNSHYTSVAAYLRRIIRVYPEVKDQYRMPGSCSIDKSKVKSDEVLDVYSIRISWTKSSSSTTYDEIFFTNPVDGTDRFSAAESFRFLFNLYKTSRDESNKVINFMADENRVMKALGYVPGEDIKFHDKSHVMPPKKGASIWDPLPNEDEKGDIKLPDEMEFKMEGNEMHVPQVSDEHITLGSIIRSIPVIWRDCHRVVSLVALSPLRIYTQCYEECLKSSTDNTDTLFGVQVFPILLVVFLWVSWKFLQHAVARNGVFLDLFFWFVIFGLILKVLWMARSAIWKSSSEELIKLFKSTCYLRLKRDLDVKKTWMREYLASIDRKHKLILVTGAVAIPSLIYAFSRLSGVSKNKSATPEVSNSTVPRPSAPEPQNIAEGILSKPVPDQNFVVSDFDKRIGAGKPVEVLPNKLAGVMSQWQVRRTIYDQGIRGQTDTAALSRIYGNLYKFEVICDGISSSSRCLALKQDIVMFPTHVLRRFNQFPIKALIYPIESSDKQRLSSEYIIHETQIRDIEDDISIVRLPFHASSLIKYLLPRSNFPGFCSGYIEGGDLSMITLSSDPVEATGPTGRVVTTVRSVLKYNFKDHRVGMCGTPIIGKNVTGLFIIGKHFCGDTNSSLCFGNSIDKVEVESVISDLESSSRYVRMSEGELQISTFSPLPKSMFHYEFLPQAIYYGFDGKAVAPSKSSKVQENELLNHKEIHEIIDRCGPATKTYCPPLMWYTSGKDYVNPYNVNVVGICAVRKNIDQGIIDRIVNEITERFLKSLRERGIHKLEPWNIDMAVNGHPSDKDIRGLNMTTSSGYGFKSPKSAEFPLSPDGRRAPSEAVLKGLHRILCSYEREEMAMPIFSGSLKDEPVSLKKKLSGKTRLFCYSSVDFLLACKIFLGPFFTLMLKFPDVFCTGIGMDCHREAHEMACKLLGFSDKYLAGDYGKYDQSMPLQVALATSEIIMRCLTAFGYSDYQLLISRGLLSDLNSPLINVLGDMFIVPGYQPSGCLGTAETNSIRNLILQMYVYYRLSPEGDFFLNNLSYTYGDDMIVATRNPVMTNVNFHKIITQEIGMDYTSVDKGLVTRDFDAFSDLMWLRRRFRWSHSRGKYVLCIDPDSLHRMVTWVIPSSECTPHDQSFGILDSLSREIFFYYDEEKGYMSSRSDLITALTEKGWDEKVLKKRLPSWASILKSLDSDMADETDLTAEKGYSLPDTGEDPGLALEGQERINSCRSYLASPGFVTTPWVEEKQKRDLHNRVETIKRELPGSLNKCFRSNKYFESTYFRKDVDLYFQSLISHRFVLEGDVTQVSRDGVPEHVFKTQNIQDSTGDEANLVKTHDSNNARVLTRPNLSLDKFFARPLQLATIPLELGANIDTYLDPWNTYVLNPAVRAKLRNYAYLKGTLKVRAIISGTPFHYGKVLLSYLPYPLSNPVRETYRVIGPTPSPYQENFSKYLSQQYGSVVLDVRSNKPTDMEIPFIGPQPVARLFNNSSTPGDVYEDLAFTGFLYINNLTSLGSVSGSTSTNLTLYIYAWMENVELGTNTATLVNLVTEGDERRVGPLETLSGIGKRVSDALMVIPEIEPFAKASSIILGGLQSLSAYFGWSYPILVEQPMRVKNLPLQNGMNVIGTDTGFSLTMDPLQELSVDPRFLGVTKDELTISHLVSIPSYVHSFDWLPTNLPLQQPIWRFPVCPGVNVSDTLGNVQPSALSYATQPFLWWHGDITYTFHIAGSDFHRGRFMIYYEPNVAQKTLIDSNLDMNKQYVMTVDLQSAQTVEFCVKWSQPRPWLRVPSVSKGANLYTQISGVVTDAAEFCNGYIGVTPLSELQSPDSSPVEIIVYVKSDNMKVNVMSLLQLPTNRLLVPPEMKLEGDLRPFEGELKCMELNEEFGDDQDMVSNYFGELPISFRAMLKRFENTRIGSVTSNVTGDAVMRVRTSLYPRIIPAMGQNSTALPLSRNLLSYLRLSFLGIRGGYRHRFYSTAPNAANNVAPTVAEMRTATSNGPADDAFVTSATSAFDLFNNNMGRVSYIPRTNGGIEYCVPFYSNNLFGWSARDDFLDDNASTMMDDFGVKEHQVQSVFKGTPDTIWYMLESASGEDFMLTRWVGAAPYNLGTPV